MIRLDLDTSVLNRPFDDQSQVKIFLETQVMLLIVQLIEDKQIELVRKDSNLCFIKPVGLYL